MSCKDIKDSNEDAATGEYCIDPTNSNDEFTVFCDMQTDGGNYCILGGERARGCLLSGNFSSKGRWGKSPGDKVKLEGHSLQSTRRNIQFSLRQSSNNVTEKFVHLVVCMRHFAPCRCIVKINKWHRRLYD